jgi:uncharacterized membrane protein
LAGQYRRQGEGIRYEITEQIPGKRIAWRSIGGTDNGGVVTFHHLNNTTSRIMVQIGYEPEGLVEKAGDLLGVASHRVQGDLERFNRPLTKGFNYSVS